MAASLEETLIWVWHQAMGEEARRSPRKAGSLLRGGRAGPDGTKWIFVSRVITNSAGLSRILKQHLAGPNRLAKERRLCNFLSERRYIAVVVAGTVQSCGAAPVNQKVKQDEHHEDECRD
jgi:hypothetical protein